MHRTQQQPSHVSTNYSLLVYIQVAMSQLEKCIGQSVLVGKTSGQFYPG